METEKELNDAIMAMITKINERSPELAKYIDEMPISIPNDATPEINIKTMREYLESLKTLLDRYEAEQSIASQQKEKQ